MKLKENSYIFWLTGLPGSGKSNIGKLLLPMIKKKYGATILIHGDNIRNIYNIKNYDHNFRLKLGKSNFNLCKFIASQGVNVIFTTVGLIHKLHSYNRNNYKNYVEIFIESNIKQLINKKKKKFYRKITKNLVGIDIIPQFPKKPHIKICNDFSKSIAKLKEELFLKIIKIL